MSYKLVHDSDIEYRVMIVEIIADSSKMAMDVVYVPTDVVDTVARSLSKLVPTGYVKVTQMARNKAIYVNGERTQVTDYHNFYSDLTEEEYETTKILCSETHRWI